MRSAPLYLAAVTLVACVEDHPRPAAHRVHEPQPAQQSAASIGFGDGAVPQIHSPVREFPAHVETAPVGLTPYAALAALPDGGALLAWAEPAATGRALSTLRLRRYSATGEPGQILMLRTVPGAVRNIAIAATHDDALVAWNASFGGRVSQIHAQRLRFDGTMLNGDFGIGTFRVSPKVADAGTEGDSIGFYVGAVATANGYAVGLRGPMLDCTGTHTQCETIRGVDIDPYDSITGRGGPESPRIAGPVVLAASPTGAWSFVLLEGETATGTMLGAFGVGPLSQLAHRPAAALVGAWIADGHARAIIRDATGSMRLLRGDDDVALPGTAITGIRAVCVNGVPSVQVQGPSTPTIVSMREPGGESVMASALGPELRAGRVATPAPRPNALALGAGGLMIARDDGIHLARCAGDTLGAPVLIPWSLGADGGT